VLNSTQSGHRHRLSQPPGRKHSIGFPSTSFLANQATAENRKQTATFCSSTSCCFVVHWDALDIATG